MPCSSPSMPSILSRFKKLVPIRNIFASARTYYIAHIQPLSSFWHTLCTLYGMNNKMKKQTIKINKMKRSILITAIAITAFTTHIFAQGENNSASHDVTISIPEVALLDIEGVSTITLVWVNYSSVVASRKTRSVNAKI